MAAKTEQMSADIIKQSGPLTIRDGESLKDFKRRMRNLKMAKEALPCNENPADWITDEYELSLQSALWIRGRTGIAYNEDMIGHKCEWVDNHPECPERYIAIMDRLRELGLIERCQRIEQLEIDVETIKMLHDARHITILEELCANFDLDAAETLASNYDSIYFNKETFRCAQLAAATTLGLVTAVAEGQISNGLAVVRPPGHHAQHAEFNGYCYFNNVAIAAKSLQQRKLARKILIIDFDVHHGQGIQDAFYDDNSVMYFSIHRFEHGEFWPNLRRSDFDHIGKDAGTGFNINVPLNVAGCGDAEYMAIVTHLLLPLAYEFQPDVILFCAGYDACIGCPEGCMQVTPAFYGHLITLLSGLAYGKLAVVLEGGYFLPSLAEGVAMTVRALLDDAPALLRPLGAPKEEVIATINDVKSQLSAHWACFKSFASVAEQLPDSSMTQHKIVQKFSGVALQPPFDTRDCYPVTSATHDEDFALLVNCLRLDYGLPQPNRVCYAYDETMLLHSSQFDRVENPMRLKALMDRFIELKLDKRCTKVDVQERNIVALAKGIHGEKYLEELMKPGGPEIADHVNDLFWEEDGSKQSISTAVASLVAICDAVMTGGFTSGVALIRPPGHHSESTKTCGFCFVNNVAIAANYILDMNYADKILILDFDIHHGNGTQEIFYDSQQIFYVSVHKYESGTFFPHSSDGGHGQFGEGSGKGYNLNVPFENDKMSCVDYLTTFFRIILPLCYSFNPDVILVSAGFDAGINDLLGNYKVLPQTFGHMIQLLKPLARGRLILALEGGYNVNTLKHSMMFCIKTLLGDPLPPPSDMTLHKESAQRTFADVIASAKGHWPTFNVERKLDHSCK